MKASPALLFVSLASLAVIAAIGTGLAVIGPPALVRIQRLDQQRVQDLRAISIAVQAYSRMHDILPEALDMIQRQGEWQSLHLRDAVSGLPYEYSIKNASSYELCAQFDAVSADDENRQVSSFWRHGRGRYCFSLEAKTRNPF